MHRRCRAVWSACAEMRRFGAPHWFSSGSTALQDRPPKAYNPQTACSADASSRSYPFKAPLKRIKAGYKWTQNPAMDRARLAPRAHSGHDRPPRPRRDPNQVAVMRVPLKDRSDGVRVHLGRRLGRPLLRRIQRRAATAGEDRPFVVRHDIWEEEALSHNTGMQLLFLGTGRGHPAEQRRTGAVAMKLSRSTWLFDCGEDTQRQVHKQPLIRHGKLDRIFITNASASNILGLPGMLCTMSAAREVGLDLADIPLHIYGPPGLAEFIRPLLQLSDTYISMPVLVHELVEHPVSERDMSEPKCLDRRSCLFRVLLPPDKLNPQGYHDGTITPFLNRATSRTSQLAKGPDERANPRDLVLPPPGNPRSPLNGLRDLRWTIKCDRENLVTAARIGSDMQSWAFVTTEVAKVGRLDVERCQRLKVLPGIRYSQLKDGLSVNNLDGQIIRPSQVLGPDIPGRKVVIVGEASDGSTIADLAEGADAIVHCASSQVRQAVGPPVLKSIIDEASAFCKAVNAQHLILYRFKPAQEDGKAPFKRAEADMSLDSGGKEQESLLRELNTVGKLQLTRKDAYGGYLRRARHHWDPVDSPPEVVKAAEHFAAEIYGRPGRVSVADDMDLFSIERRVPGVEWEEQPEKAATA